MRISDWSSDVCSSDLLWRRTASADARGGPTLTRTFRTKERCGPMGEATQPGRTAASTDRKSAVEGKSVSVRVDLGESRIIKKKTTHNRHEKEDVQQNTRV